MRFTGLWVYVDWWLSVSASLRKVFVPDAGSWKEDKIYQKKLGKAGWKKKKHSS